MTSRWHLHDGHCFYNKHKSGTMTAKRVQHYAIRDKQEYTIMFGLLIFI